MSEINNINNEQKEQCEIFTPNMNKIEQAFVNPENKIILSFYFILSYIIFIHFLVICGFCIANFIYINEIGGKMITGFLSLLILIGLTIYAQKAHTKIELIKNESDNLLTIKKYNLFCCEKYSVCICLENVLIAIF